MRAEGVIAIAEKKRMKKVEEARKYAEKHFRPTLKKIFKRIKKASQNNYNKIEMGITVESLIVTGQWTEREFRKKLLADKIIATLVGMGYTVVPSTTSDGGLLTNPVEALLGAPVIITPTVITAWTIKW